MGRFSIVILSAVLIAACAGADDSVTDDSAAASPPAAVADPDQPTGGSGVPAGYLGRLDAPDARPMQQLAEVSYTREDDKWRVATGPAHILYQAGDTVTGAFTASTRMHVMNSDAAHPEAFGLFLGGRNLDGPAAEYSYFLVRGTGEYYIARREASGPRAVKAWASHAAIPKADSTGKAPDYHLAVRVGTDSVRFVVNEQQVAALPKAAFPTDGVVGARLNHNLQLHVWPVTITR